MALHLEVSQLVCDENQLIGLLISGLTIGLFIGGFTFSGVMLKYGQMCSHRKIFKVYLAIFQHHIRKD